MGRWVTKPLVEIGVFMADSIARSLAEDDPWGLATLGGKGANLVRLADAELPVPPFVIVPTAEYDAFVADHQGVRETLDAAVAAHAAGEITPEDASARIRSAFRAQPPTDAQRARLAGVLERLNLDAHAVAVRSSATAEDLPDLSFAGQQDTYLEVRGLDDVVARIVDAWASLWTERAIAYRARNDVGGTLSLAVVVQRMVDADVSGVLFTADPLTGQRSVTTIDAVEGLGEQLVSGQVTPENLRVDTASGRLLSRTPAPGRDRILSPAEASALTALGRRVAELDGVPQDIEWAIDGDRAWLLQARPITSLFPIPDGPATAVWMSFGAVQGMLEPITTLGRDILVRLLSSVPRLGGIEVDAATNPYLRPAAERLWLRLDRVLDGPLRPLAARFLPLVEPTAAAVVGTLLTERRPAGRRLPRPGVRVAAAMAGRVLPRVPVSLARPELTRANLDAAVTAYLDGLDTRLDAAARPDDPDARLLARVAAAREFVRSAFPMLLPRFGPVIVPALAMLRRLQALAARSPLPDASALTLTILRAVPGNVTTTMDLDLWRAAQTIRRDPDARDALAGAEPAQLAARFRAGTLPPVAQDAVAGFLADYGMRGVAEIDLGTPRWREQPDAVFATLASYNALDDPSRAPDVVFARGEAAAGRAIETLASSLGRRDAAQLRFLAGRLRRLIGARETPKFAFVRGLGAVREALLASGDDLVAAGVLGERTDVVHLTLDELAALARGWRAASTDPAATRALVDARAAARAREARRVRVPVVLAGDGRAFFEGATGAPLGSPAGGSTRGAPDAPDAPGADTAGATLHGTGVSPGAAEGRVRIMRDPRLARLEPGDILVCAGTDPAWTPLFLTAGGLVTEVGGLMTHGSVVAREYGIPAVVGIPHVTRILKDGEPIRIDGTAGVILRAAPQNGPDPLS